MIDSVQISLIGAKTYGTLSTVYQAGEPREVTTGEWAKLKVEVNPATGDRLFCLTSDLPPVPADLDIEALSLSGLGPELDTGASFSPHREAIQAEEDGDYPRGASDTDPVGEVKLSQLIDTTPDSEQPSLTHAEASQDAQKPDLVGSQASKKLTIGGRSKAVTV